MPKDRYSTCSAYSRGARLDSSKLYSDVEAGECIRQQKHQEL